MKVRWEWIVPFVPALIGVVAVTVLDSLGIVQFNFAVDDLDSIIILTGLIITIILSSVLVSRQAVKQMRLVSLKQAQQEYNAERSRFLRRLDHELKNPLMGIQLALTSIADEEDSESRQKNRDGVERQLKRVSRLVTDLRKVADLGLQNLELFPLDLTDLLQEVYAQAVEETPVNARDLRFKLPEPAQRLAVIFGDRDLLLVAFYNLLSNALKYTRNGDTVELRAYIQDEAAVIEVRDTGIGIASTDLPYIWDELYRCEQVREIPGSGIGLALVKLVVERHNGKIEVESQLDQGTTMRIYLPTMPVAEPVMGLMKPVS